jgi:hypothetical protein
MGDAAILSAIDGPGAKGLGSGQCRRWKAGQSEDGKKRLHHHGSPNSPPPVLLPNCNPRLSE